MLIRMTFLSFLPEKINKAKNYYKTEVVPVVKKQKGNIDCMLLDPVREGDEYVSMTIWDNEEDAGAYHNSGLYRKLVDQLKDSFAKEPVLRVYSTESAMAHI